MCVEAKAITETLKWFCSSTEHHHATILTDTKITLAKIRDENLYTDLFLMLQDIQDIKMTRLEWIFCPGHPGVQDNEKADRLVNSADVLEGLTLDAPTVLAVVSDSLTNAREEESYTKKILSSKEVKLGEGRKSNMRDPARRRTNQLLTETVGVPTPRWTLLRRGEELWISPDSSDPSPATK